MATKGGLSDLLNDVVTKYILFHLEGPPRVEEQDDKIDHVDLSEGLVRVIEKIPNLNEEILAIDGSSRSFVFSQGLVSVSSVSVISSSKGIIGMFPSFNPNMSLGLKEPFIAIATPFNGPERIEDFLLHPAISRTSIDGTNFHGDFSRLETELRFSLETECLEKVRQSPLVLIDGPLMPRFLYLNKKVADKLLEKRNSLLQKNFLGVVKRVNNSTVLLNSLRYEDSRKLSLKYGVNPYSFSNDEAFLIHLMNKNFKPPFKPIVVGPLLRNERGREIISNYVVIPFHPFLAKFSVLRVESLTNELNPEIILSMPISKDGIPVPLAFADKVAKEVSNAVFSLLIQELISRGVQSSFYSRLEGMGT